MTGHAPCGKSWTGKRAEHCPVCCETFSGTTTGDRHRVGPFTRRRCVPAFLLRLLGMEQNAHGVWGTGDRSLHTAPRRSA